MTSACFQSRTVKSRAHSTFCSSNTYVYSHLGSWHSAPREPPGEVGCRSESLIDKSAKKNHFGQNEKFTKKEQNSPIKVVLRFKRRLSASRIFCPIKNSLRSEEVMSTWKKFAKKIRDFSKKIFFQDEHFSLEILKKKSMFLENRKFSFFRKFRNFDEKSIFLRISYEKSIFGKMFTSDFFLKKKSRKFFFAKNFQVDITSSDLNEFLIGQKILEAYRL